MIYDFLEILGLVARNLHCNNSETKTFGSLDRREKKKLQENIFTPFDFKKMKIFQIRICGLLIASFMGSTSPTFADFTEFDQFGTGNSHGVAWGDYDNDGDLDLAVCNRNQQNKLYRNDGGGLFFEMDRFGVGDIGLAWGDYDNDDDLDMAASNFNRGTVLFRNEGGDSFVEVDTFEGPLRTLSVAWGDYDNDGDLDLALGNSGQNMLVRNEGGGNFNELNNFGLSASFSITWGDYDNDDDLDLAVVRAYTIKENMLWRNDGNDIFTLLSYFGAGNSYGTACGDCDNDGDLDLVVTNEDTTRLYVNNQNAYNYIKVKLVGLGTLGYSNRDGLGAKIKVYDAGTTNLRGYREVNAGSGFWSMNSLEQVFGALEGDSFDVEVSWPASGNVCLVEDIIPPVTLTILENCVVTGVEENILKPEVRSSNFRLLQNRPNPCNHITSIQFRLSTSTYVTLKIYDPLGCLVRKLINNEIYHQGNYEVHWDGKDDYGSDVKSGIFLYKMSEGAFFNTGKIILLN